MNRAEAWQRFAEGEHAVLGTVDAERGVHLVPVVHTCVDPSTIVVAIDEKPKSTRALRRTANIASDPQVSLLVEHYDPDWSRLWWVRVDGTAVVRETVPEAVFERHLARHPQQLGQRLDPWIVITADRVRGWSADG